MKTRRYNIIGVNTGNSLDAADVVLTEFQDEQQSDQAFTSVSLPEKLKEELRALRRCIEAHKGDLPAAIQDAAIQKRGDAIIRDYTSFVADAVKVLLLQIGKTEVDAVGFHGQTCAHFPPSVARKHDADPYTVQVGDGQQLADALGITVVYDFRSDDVMLGGEGAPLAPVHHQHLAEATKKNGCFPIAFCNAGNTGNVSIISGTPEETLPTLGWDNGPFNDYPDLLCREEKGIPCDENGIFGKKGKINIPLLQLLFERAATTDTGENFLLLPPPKSGDPQWYRRLPELLGKAPIGGAVLSFEDRLRTAEYFAAYVFAYGLSMTPKNYPMPRHFAVCGGGWKNPVIFDHFADLLQGREEKSPLLPEHKKIFSELRTRLGSSVEIKPSADYGFDGQAMEARIFADAALSRLMGKPFSFPESTGVVRPAILGLVRFPQGKIERASVAIQELIKMHTAATPDGAPFDSRWSRAVSGWKDRLARKEPA